jgi:hypothetical protein
MRENLLQQNFKKKVTNNVHVEGSAACSIDGSIILIGCFLGMDVDNKDDSNGDNDSDDNNGDSDKDNNNTTDEQDNNPNKGIDSERNDESDQKTNEYENQEGYTRGLGNVLAITASTGEVVWKTPLGGEIKGAPVGEDI